MPRNDALVLVLLAVLDSRVVEFTCASETEANRHRRTDIRDIWIARRMQAGPVADAWAWESGSSSRGAVF